jgi:Protein of unknown function (DUF4239)
MNIYWIYNIPNWQFFILTLVTFILFSLIGSHLFGKYLDKWLGLTLENNETVGHFLAWGSVFYSITLGLIAVGTFESFKEVEGSVSQEASVLNGLYRSVALLEDNLKSKEMRFCLKRYAKYVSKDGWKLQQNGIIPKGTSHIVNDFEKILKKYDLRSEKDKLLYSEILKENNKLSEKRHERINNIGSGLPATIWYVILLGALINIILAWALVIPNKRLEILINTLTSALLGSLIFLIAALDNPFRGELCVDSSPFINLLDGLMKDL